MYDFSRDFSARPTYEKYRVIRPSDLPESIYQAAADANGDHRTQPDGNAKIMPYFLAQAEAFRGNVAAAAAALDKLETSGFLLNNFDQSRFQAIRNFALASGGFGPQAREKFLVGNAAQSQKAYLLLSAALIFAIAAPLTNGLGWWVARRSRRVLSIERELQERRANLPDAVKRAAGVFGSRIANKLRQPSSIANGERAVDAIASRARGYLLFVLGLLAFAALSAFAAYWIWLPEAADNTAFHFVALAGSAADYAQQNGVAVIAGADEWTVGPFLLNWLKYPICLAAIVLATRRSRYLGAVAAMVFVAFFALDDYRFSQHSRREALPQQFSQRLRSELDLAAGATYPSPITLPQPSTDVSGGLDVNLRGSIAVGKTSASAAPPMEIDPSLAAYTLAQIAYLEGNVVDASTFLNQIREVKVLYADVHCERLGADAGLGLGQWLHRGCDGLAQCRFSIAGTAIGKVAADAFDRKLGARGSCHTPGRNRRCPAPPDRSPSGRARSISALEPSSASIINRRQPEKFRQSRAGVRPSGGRRRPGWRRPVRPW
ncbi:UNVERIFIED_ORG: hypothetical protein GGI66_002581 [Rhizobium esperanzae]